MCLEQTSWQSGAVLHGAVRTTSSSSMAQVHYNMYTYSQAGAHHITATNGLESLRPCSLSDVTVEGSRLSRTFRRFHLRIWPGDQGWDQCPSIDKANCSCHRVKLSCTIYYFCSTGVLCRNSLIKNEDGAGDEQQHTYEHGHDMITMNRTRKKTTSWMIAI